MIRRSNPRSHRMTRPTLFALGLLTAVGCGGRPEAKPPAAPTPPAGSPKAPGEPSYAISSDVDESPVRRVVEVKLAGKVTPEVLRQIALEVKAREERPHERTVIFYYLPAAFPGLAGEPWASTHFTPGLKVEIMGLSAVEEGTLRALRIDHQGRRIGAWLQDNQYKTLDLIYDENGTIKIAEITSPTSRVDTNMIEMPTLSGRRFRKVKGSNLYEVDLEGNLRIFNADEQLISAAKPIR